MFWHDWGPDGSLLLNVPGPDGARGAFGSPYGTRFPALVPDKRDKAAVRLVVFDLNPWAARGGGRASRGEDALVPLAQKESGAFEVRSPRASVPYVAYWGPRVAVPEGHKPTVVAMTQTGFVVLVGVGLIAPPRSSLTRFS